MRALTTAAILLVTCKAPEAPPKPPAAPVNEPVPPAKPRSFKHELKQDALNGRRLLTSPSGYQTVQQLDGGRTGLYYDAASDVLKSMVGVESIVLLGLGGGEMLRQAHVVQPNAALIGVEIDDDTIRLANEFDLPTPITIFSADAIDWIGQQPPGAYDVIMVDLFVDDEMVPASIRTTFFADCARVLEPRGTFMINVYPAMSMMMIEDRLQPFFETRRLRYDNFVLVGTKR